MDSELFAHRGTYLWKLRTHDLYENKEVEINWLTFLPENGGTKYQRSRLITSSKDFLLLMIERPYKKWRFGVSAQSVFNWYVRLRRLVRWMAEREIWFFSKLNVDDIILFLKSIKPPRSNGVPTKKYLNVYVDLLRDLWVFRHGYPGAIRIDAHTFEDDIWQECRTRELTAWRATDEDFALALINDALEWIESYGQFFIDSAQRIYSEQARWVGVTLNERGKLSHKLFSSICEQPLYTEISERAGCGLDGAGVARAFTVTIGAAINVMLFTVGLRVSELVRLDEGCINPQLDAHEQTVSYIHGIAAKKGGTPRAWVAGDPLPKVVKWVEDLHEIARKAVGLKALFVTRTQGSAIPLPRRKLRRMSVASPITAMRAFANAPFRASRPLHGNLHPHAARKTFAAFVVRRDKTALEALSLHFGHTYRAFTDGAYVGNLDLQKLLDEADREELGRALTELLASPHLAGRAASSVRHYRESSLRFRGKLILQRSVNELIARGIKVAPCNWGYCLYSQPVSMCGGDKVGPNESKRSPDVCAGCANFVVSDAHAFWWNSRAKVDQEFLANREMPSQTRDFVEKRLKKSQEIIRQLLHPVHAKNHETGKKK